MAGSGSTLLPSRVAKDVWGGSSESGPPMRQVLSTLCPCRSDLGRRCRDERRQGAGSCSASSVRRRTEYQPRPPRSASEIAIRDRSHTRYEWGQNWGHNSNFSCCNYRSRAQSKCFLEIRIVFRYRRLGCVIGSTVERTPSESDPDSISGRANWHNMPMFVSTGLASTGDNYGDPKRSAHSTPGTGYS